MAMTKKPVTGMKDILPAEMQVRDYVIGLIKETYKSFGGRPDTVYGTGLQGSEASSRTIGTSQYYLCISGPVP